MKIEDPRAVPEERDIHALSRFHCQENLEFLRNHSVKGGKDLLIQVQCFEFDLLPSSGSQSVSESASKPDPDTDPEYSVNPSLKGYPGGS